MDSGDCSQISKVAADILNNERRKNDDGKSSGSELGARLKSPQQNHRRRKNWRDTVCYKIEKLLRS
jgi:hypothetical protein